MASANQADQAVAFARSQIGKPYKFGTAGPNTYDCSGLTMAAYAHASPPISLPHFTGAQVGFGTKVAKANLAIGDLVFPDPGHVQIYSGNGMVIEAPHTGAFVREVKMWGYWTARRIVPGGGTGTPIGSLPNTITAGISVTPASVTDGLRTLSDMFNRAGLVIVGGLLIIIGFYVLAGSPGWSQVRAKLT